MRLGPNARKPPVPLNSEKLRNLALHYAERYATTRGKLGNYLARKIRERGWDDDCEPDIGTMVEQFADLGYINDAQFAEARSRSLVRRGYGEVRLNGDLRAARINEDDGQAAKEYMSESAFAAAENFARRKQIGPFAAEMASPERQQKQLQAFIRAGHGFDLAKRFVRAEPGAMLDEE